MLLIPFVSASVTIDTLPENPLGVVIKPEDILTGGGNFSFNQTLGDRTYWRLDGTNAPPSADWNMGGFGFQNVGDVVMGTNKINFSSGGGLTSNTGQARIDFEAGGINYYAPLDGHYFYDPVLLDDFSGGGEGFVTHSAVGGLQSTGSIILDISTYTNLGATSPIKLTGDNIGLNPNGNISIHNVTATGKVCDSVGCIGDSGGNPFDQSLNTTDNVNFESVVAGDSGNTYSRFGPFPVNSPSISDTFDTLVSVKSKDTTTGGIRGMLAIGEYNGTGSRAAASFGLNSFFYHSGTGNFAHAITTTGPVAGRYAFRGRQDGGTTTIGGGVASACAIQSTANGAYMGYGYSFLAEGNSVADATTVLNNSFNFWGRDSGAEAGTITNNWGIYQEEIDSEGDTMVEYAVEGAGMYAMRAILGQQPTEYMESTDVGHLDLYATTSVDVNSDLNVTGNITASNGEMYKRAVMLLSSTGSGSAVGDNIAWNIHHAEVDEFDLISISSDNRTVTLQAGVYELEAQSGPFWVSGSGPVIMQFNDTTNGNLIGNPIEIRSVTSSTPNTPIAKAVVDISVETNYSLVITSLTGVMPQAVDQSGYWEIRRI